MERVNKLILGNQGDDMISIVTGTLSSTINTSFERLGFLCLLAIHL